MLTKIKNSILGTIWPIGSTAKILRGPLKGLQFRVSDNSGWSPIVGRWEPESQLLFRQLIKPGFVIYDLGANNGIHSLLYSRLTGPSGKVFSFEPLPANVEEIQQNARLNAFDNITVVQAAVSNQSGETVFHLGLHNKQGSLVGIGRESGTDITVRLLSLDDFILSGHPVPDFLKIDIEGAESMALEGFKQTTARVHPIFYIELHTPEQDKKVGAFFLEQGYHVYRQKVGARSPGLPFSNLEPVKDLTRPYPDPDGIWGNILAIHPERLKSLLS